MLGVVDAGNSAHKPVIPIGEPVAGLTVGEGRVFVRIKGVKFVRNQRRDVIRVVLI
jgi:hypothetical protein